MCTVNSVISAIAKVMSFILLTHWKNMNRIFWLKLSVKMVMVNFYMSMLRRLIAGVELTAPLILELMV
jgi:hypothetical protein